MILGVPSIMHSGTHLLRYEILKPFADYPHHPVIEGVHYHRGGHPITAMKTQVEGWMSSSDFIVSPMRHPARILQSFISRKRPINYDIYEGSDYESQWRNFIEFYNKYDISLIHIDDEENRDEQVINFSNKIGIYLTPNWPVTKRTGCFQGNHNLELTDELINKVPSWIMDFYTTLSP